MCPTPQQKSMISGIESTPEVKKLGKEIDAALENLSADQPPILSLSNKSTTI